MASIKVKFRSSTVPDHEGTIFYQVILDRKVRQLNTDYYVLPEEWDETRSMVTTKLNSNRKSFQFQEVPKRWGHYARLFDLRYNGSIRGMEQAMEQFVF